MIRYLATLLTLDSISKSYQFGVVRHLSVQRVPSALLSHIHPRVDPRVQVDEKFVEPISRSFKAVAGPVAGRQGARHRRAVRQSARARGRLLRRRKAADSGPLSAPHRCCRCSRVKPSGAASTIVAMERPRCSPHSTSTPSRWNRKTLRRGFRRHELVESHPEPLLVLTLEVDVLAGQYDCPDVDLLQVLVLHAVPA